MKKVQSTMSGLLGVGSRFEGEIKFEGTLRIDGHILGTIVSKNDRPSTVIVSELAVVEGDIIADTVIISGKMIGDIKAVERVEIHAPGRLEGNIYTCDLMIDEGALFQGECIMIRHLTLEEKMELKKGKEGVVKKKLIQEKQMSIIQ